MSYIWVKSYSSCPLPSDQSTLAMTLWSGYYWFSIFMDKKMVSERLSNLPKTYQRASKWQNQDLDLSSLARESVLGATLLLHHTVGRPHYYYTPHYCTHSRSSGGVRQDNKTTPPQNDLSREILPVQVWSLGPFVSSVVLLKKKLESWAAVADDWAQMSHSPCEWDWPAAGLQVPMALFSAPCDGRISGEIASCRGFPKRPSM